MAGPRRLAGVLAACAAGCVGSIGSSDSEPSPIDDRPDAGGLIDSALAGPAYLHADLSSVFWNGRVRCGPERAFAHICHQRNAAATRHRTACEASGAVDCDRYTELDCSQYDSAYTGCDRHYEQYGQQGPNKVPNDSWCEKSVLGDDGGCDAERWDYEQLRFWWHGSAWNGCCWPFATLKVFESSLGISRADPEPALNGSVLAAFSNLPGVGEVAMAGLDNGGIGASGCAMLGHSSGSDDDKYRTPFGGFAWIEVPTDRPVTVVAVAGADGIGDSFDGCHRGDPAGGQDSWIRDAPGAVLGCVYVEEAFRFEPGRHYYWAHGVIEELAVAGPPAALVAGFGDAGRDVGTIDGCTP